VLMPMVANGDDASEADGHDGHREPSRFASRRMVGVTYEPRTRPWR